MTFIRVCVISKGTFHFPKKRDKYSPFPCGKGKKTVAKRMFDANMLCPFIVSLDNMQYCGRFNKSLLAAHLSHDICLYMYCTVKRKHTSFL